MSSSFRRRRVSAAAVALSLTLGLAACSASGDRPKVGLITKQENNPYWVALKGFAQDQAGRSGVELVTATGSSDVDVAGQRAAIERMLGEGVSGIAIAVTDSSALNGAIAQARERGVPVIAIDTPTDPVDAVNAYFSTDNTRAGELIGSYAKAKAAELGLQPAIAMLDLAPGIESGEQRRAGFLAGFGIGEDDAAVRASVDTQGDRGKGKAAMAQILFDHPDVNVVYTVNEEAALGALEALREANADLARIVLVSIDGGCQAMKGPVRAGGIDATAMQFPENMAREAVKAFAQAADGGSAPSGYLDTGTELVTGSPAAGVPARDVEFGVRTCWGS